MVPTRVLAVVFGLLALAACDPMGVPSDPADAAIRIELQPTGSATGNVRLARSMAEELRPVTTSVVTELLGIPSRVAIEGNGSGAAFAVFTVPDVFEPGERPSTAVVVDDTTFAGLRELGVESVDLTVCRPFVDNELDASPPPAADGTGCASFPLDAATGRADVSISMHPRPARWYWSMVVLAILLVSTIVAGYLVRGRPLATRRRSAVVAAAGTGLVAFAVSVPLQPAAPHGDNLGVAGLLDDVALTVATWAPVAILPLGAACVALAAAAFMRPRQRGTVYAHPRATT